MCQNKEQQNLKSSTKRLGRTCQLYKRYEKEGLVCTLFTLWGITYLVRRVVMYWYCIGIVLVAVDGCASFNVT